MINYDYVVSVPPYDQKSNGVVVLYQLFDLIRETGRKARLALIPDGTNNHLNTPYQYRSQYTSHIAAENEIVIYPDVVSNNPFLAKNVVRYLLNRPCYLSRKSILYDRTDYLLSFSNYIDEHLPKLFILDKKLKHIKSNYRPEKEKIIATYLGKADSLSRPISSLLKHLSSRGYRLEIITRTHPESKEKYYALLAKASGLITADPLSNVILESLIFDTTVYLPHDEYRTEHISIDVNLNGLTFTETDFLRALEQNEDLGVSEQVDMLVGSNLDRLKKTLTEIEVHFETINGSDANARVKLLNANEQTIFNQFNKDNLNYSNHVKATAKPIVRRLINKSQRLFKFIRSI